MIQLQWPHHSEGKSQGHMKVYVQMWSAEPLAVFCGYFSFLWCFWMPGLSLSSVVECIESQYHIIGKDMQFSTEISFLISLTHAHFLELKGHPGKGHSTSNIPANIFRSLYLLENSSGRVGSLSLQLVLVLLWREPKMDTQL